MSATAAPPRAPSGPDLPASQIPPPEPPPSFRRRPRIWRLLLGCLLVVVKGEIRTLAKDLRFHKAIKLSSGALAPAGFGDAQTILLVGNDQRNHTTTTPVLPHSNEMLLVRIDPSKPWVSMMSIPRELMVPIQTPGGPVTTRLNAALEYGGISLLVSTIKQVTGLSIMGPGLIVMVGDNDAGGVATYAQAGQNYRLTLLWALVLLVPVLIVNQEMVVRLGAVTGVGHARLIIERFGKFWGAFSVGDLFILNFLTIVTEFIGVSLALGYFGVSECLAGSGRCRRPDRDRRDRQLPRWERFMFVFVVTNFIAIPLAIISHPHLRPIVHGALTPGVEGGFNSTSMLLIIAIVGTHRRSVAAVLSAVQRDRQADHPTVDQL